MPPALERKLMRRAQKLRRAGKLRKKDTGAYVYGTLRKQGWKPRRERR